MLVAWKGMVELELDDEESDELSVVFKRNSCVTAIPIEAKDNEVRSHARNVRSWGIS